MSAHGYNPVTPEVLDELRAIVGERFVETDPEKLEPYSHDETHGVAFRAMPEVVVKPRTAEEIAAVVRLANRRRIPVTPRGAGSGYSAGAVPLYGGIVLATERMDDILEVDEANMMVVVEPGVVTNDINEKLAPLGLWYAGYPIGVTERYVLGLEMVTPTGEIVRLGGKRVKDVTGYNLRKLIVGSEGTLGIVTQVILRLVPLPKAVVDLLVLFPDAGMAIGAVPRMITRSGVVPTAIEFMDRLSVRAACEFLNEHLPWRACGAMLLIELDGPDEATVTRDYDAVGALCTEEGAQEVYVADNRTTRDRVWSVRKNIPEALNAITPHQSMEDIVVPPAAIAEVITVLARLTERHGITIPCFGHAGDGNLHTRLMKNPDESLEDWERREPEILSELYRETAALGGTISGEHGIGAKKKPFLPLVMSEAEMDLMRRIKRALDPDHILNPGKIVDVPPPGERR